MVSLNRTMIKILKSNQQFFIWNAEDAHILREKHRIVGTLVGCLPRNPLQNSHLGLPLLLMTCEVRLLVEKGIAYIVDEGDIKKVEDLAEKIAKQRETVYHEQVLLCRKGKRKEMEQNMESVVKGKTRKINDIVSHGDQVQQDNGPTDITGLLAKELALEEQKIEEFTLPLESSVIQIHTARFPEESLECIPVSTSWCLQLSKEDLLRYHTFLHFWEQGYFLTCGTKFGGDFLVYPGDPSRFHSFYVVACYESDKEMNVMKLLRMSRLGNSVKKTFVIASVDLNNGNKVNCWSLQRAED